MPVSEAKWYFLWSRACYIKERVQRIFSIQCVVIHIFCVIVRNKKKRQWIVSFDRSKWLLTIFPRAKQYTHLSNADAGRVLFHLYFIKANTYSIYMFMVFKFMGYHWCHISSVTECVSHTEFGPRNVAEHINTITEIISGWAEANHYWWEDIERKLRKIACETQSNSDYKFYQIFLLHIFVFNLELARKWLVHSLHANVIYCIVLCNLSTQIIHVYKQFKCICHLNQSHKSTGSSSFQCQNDME